MPRADRETAQRQQLERRSLQRDAQTPARYAQRRCLRCNTWFRSTGPNNRRCELCAVAIATMRINHDAAEAAC